MNTSRPAVTVVIPTYNRARFIGGAVDSVLAQTYRDFAVVVVDDGSTDETPEILNRYCSAITVLRQSNAGVSAARNTGIRAAVSPWLAFLDSDDEWEPDYLERQMAGIARQRDLVMQIANARFLGRNGESRSYFDINGILPQLRPSGQLVPEFPFVFIALYGPWQLGAALIRRDSVLEAGLFDTRLHLSEDYDLLARVALRGPVRVIARELVRVYRRDEALESLTVRAGRKPLDARRADELVFAKLQGEPGLRAADRKLLRRLASANRRAMGNLLLEAGDAAAARASFRRAAVIDPSARALGKYALSFLPPGFQSWVAARQRGPERRRGELR